MAINACPICGNARGSKDCEEACSNREQNKSLKNDYYKDELAPFIEQSVKETETEIGRRIDLDNCTMKMRNHVMAKAVMNWLKSKK